MLTIRFSRVGKKNRAYFRLVLTESSAPVKGRFTELLGSYDPHSKKAVLKTERLLYWKEKGATLSPSVHNLLVKEGILKEKKVAIKMERKQPEKAESAEEKVTEEKSVKEKTEEKTEAAAAVVEEAKTEEVKTEEKMEEKPVEEKVEEKKEALN